ncbi:MAG: efflux RND transporter periplasmic adaptor subunit [Gammaproteobacteria bacterium]|nr:efflux RND transporter periplasmic adaptor subunit [Gammaproteobacteria bacterium]
MNKLTRVWGTLGAMTVLGFVLAYLAGFFHAKIDPDTVTTRTVAESGEVVVVEAVRETVFEQATGTVQAKDETVISARITATISKVTVRAGDRVSRGAPLVELDARESAARLAQQKQVVSAAKARLTQAKSDYERTQNIFKTTPAAISRADVDAAVAVLRSAEAEFGRARRAVEEARTTSSYARINAPIDGTVIDRYADPGDTATPGKPLLRLYNPRLLRLEANVRESLVTRLVKGSELAVRIDALNADLGGVVEEIVPSADPGSRSFLVKVTLPENELLYPGMFGRLRIPSAETERYYVPAVAVRRMGQLEFVMAETSRGPVRRYVRTGGRGTEGGVEVLSGLEPGDRVVVSQ